MHQIEFRAMGSQMHAIVDDDSAAAAEALAQVPAWFEAWEQALSRFRPDSELSRLNQAHGQAMPVGPLLWDAVDLAFTTERASGGLVTPTQLSALEAAGYDRSFDALPKSGERPADPEWPLGVPRPAPDLSRAVRRDARQHTLQLADGVRLDLGGVGKGWAADEAARRLAGIGPALVDAGGDISISAARAGATPWTVSIANPFFPDDGLESLQLTRRLGLATSGRDHRRWQRNGRWLHHILDPRTGQPAQTDLITATVLAATTARAEMAAKVALILGSQAGLAWLAARTDLAGCLVMEDGRVLRTDSLAAYTPVMD